MTKRSLYAYIGAALQGCALVLAGLPGSAVAAAQAPAPCGACVAVLITPGEAVALPAGLDGLEVLVRATNDDVSAALETIEERGGRPGLLFDLRGAAVTPEMVFALKRQISGARAARERVLVGLAADVPLLELSPYLDFTLSASTHLRPTSDSPQTDLRPSFDSPQTDLRRSSGVRPSWVEARSTGAVALAAEAGGGGADRWVWRAPGDVTTLASVVSDLARLRRLMPVGMIPAPTVEVTCAGATVPAYLNPQTLETIGITSSCPAGAAIGADPPEPGIERVDLSDATLIRVPAPSASDRFAEGVDVTGARTLTVEEIVARHQAAAARQAARVRTDIATGTLTLTFEAPGFPAPVTIGSETVIYTTPGRTDLEQRAIRVNGIAFRGTGVPKLPIIEPERVAAPPLTITLTNIYRYRLDGRDTISGTPCFVVAFEPVDPRAALFRGRAWIAADDFGMVQVGAVQTGLRGPIVASEQTDAFTRHGDGLWLLARSDTRQMYEGAAHRTPIHRVLALDTHLVNAADFEARRDAAYRSPAVMLRDTPDGYRYLTREPRKPGEPVAAVEPLVAARADRIRTLAAGVIVDPNISVPLPFAGLSYVDFNLLGTGAQLNAFFGGTYGQLAFSVPSLGGSRWQLAGRAFAIASSYNDRAFVQGREIYADAVRQRPASASVWALRPLAARVTMRAGYELDYTRFSAASETSPAFLVPANQLVHGVRLALDAQLDGWNASLWWNGARRSGWRTWGADRGSAFDAQTRDFQRYGATVTRSAVITPGLAARVEGAVMAGSDLDRFSRFSFGTFDNRLRGYPSALIRYDRGGVVRGALAWAARPFVRLDLFADTAVVRDPGFGRAYRNYTGVGAALEAPAPFGTLVAVEWGYGFRGVTATGHIGTQVIRVTGYKVF